MKNIKIFLISLILLLGATASSVVAEDFGCSSSYCLDFGDVEFGAENLQSASFEAQAGTAPIDTNSISSNYEIIASIISDFISILYTFPFIFLSYFASPFFKKMMSSILSPQ